MKNAFLTLILVVSLMASGWTESVDVGLVTQLTGQARSQGEPVHYLQYLKLDQELTLSDDSSAVVSFVRGGRRVSLVGPCSVKLKIDGAVTLEGHEAHLIVPTKRTRASQIPAKRDLSTSGAIRRGGLELFLGHRILPSADKLYFTAFPGQNDFVVTVFDSQSRKTAELVTQDAGCLSLEQGTLKPGESYEFVLDGYSPGGQSSKDHQMDVRVLTPEEEEEFREYERFVLEAGTEVDKSELLVQYLELSLHQEAMELVEELQVSFPNSSALADYHEQLQLLLNP